MGHGRIELLEKMLEQDPGDAFCRYGLAQEHLKAGNIDEALTWFDRTIESDRDYCYAYYHKARALEQAGRIEDAATVLRTGLERATASGDSHAAAEIQAFLGQLS